MFHLMHRTAKHVTLGMALLSFLLIFGIVLQLLQVPRYMPTVLFGIVIIRDEDCGWLATKAFVCRRRYEATVNCMVSFGIVQSVAAAAGILW